MGNILDKQTRLSHCCFGSFVCHTRIKIFVHSNDIFTFRRRIFELSGSQVCRPTSLPGPEGTGVPDPTESQCLSTLKSAQARPSLPSRPQRGLPPSHLSFTSSPPQE